MTANICNKRFGWLEIISTKEQWKLFIYFAAWCYHNSFIYILLMRKFSYATLQNIIEVITNYVINTCTS